MTEITREELQQVYDFERENRVVLDACRAATADILAVLRFVGRYAAWNGLFGAGVAALAGKIGRSRRLFLERAEPISALADRSVPVASYFFDAARDEFDDRDTAHRDTHRCLAQALLKGIIAYGRRERTEWTDPAFVNALLCEPVWLQALTARVGHGYGAMSPDELPAIFRCMGYHLGSEVLADQEFSIIDLALATDCPDLVAYLRHTEVEIAGRLHSAYRWFSIHSGHGGAVEAEHFAWATRGRAWPSIISSPISMTRCTSNCSWVSWISPATIASFSKTSTVLDIEEATMAEINLFSRLSNLWKGFVSLWIADVEKNHPEIAYENAINAMVTKYTKLKSATAAIIRRREEIEDRVEREEKLLAQITADLSTALDTRQDDLALVVLQKKNAVEAELAGLQGEMAQAKADADEAKDSLTAVMAEIKHLKAEKDRMLAKVKSAEARIHIQDQLDGLSVDAEVKALDNVREHIKNRLAEADLGKEMRESDLDRRLTALRQQGGIATARSQLDALKAARAQEAEAAKRSL